MSEASMRPSGTHAQEDPRAVASRAARKQGGAAGDSHSIYLRLRQDILTGVLPPGHILNTVHISQHYSVSRTPVREALRMLQAEGLADAPYQYRMRVTAVTPGEVDAVYATWILMQSLAVGLTVPRTGPQELDELRSTVEAMNRITPLNARSKAAWEKLHTRYNQLLIRHAGAEIAAAIETCWLRSERARRMNMRTSPSWADSASAHSAVLSAFEQGSAAEAVRLVSMHLARVALDVIKHIDAEYEPRAIHEALALTAGRRKAAVVASAPRRADKVAGRR